MKELLTADEGYQQGLKHLGQNKPAEAEACFRVAIHARPDWPDAHNNLGVALSSRNRHADAIECFRRAIELKPDYAEPQHNMANSLRRTGKPDEAVVYYREAIRLKPGWADAHNNLGLTFRTLGQLDEALEQFREALRAKPRHPDARNNLGVTLCDKGLMAEATATYRQLLQQQPKSAESNNNLGVALVQQGKLAEAVACYRRALEIRPNYAEACSNLGNAFRQQGQFEDAEASLRKALELKPDYAEAYNNLAIVLVKQERLEEAVANYRQALQLKPDYPDARKNLGLALLGMGDFSEGWKEYEWRWKSKEMPNRNFAQPRWDGAPLEGRTILLYAEQGLGDTIQFARYAPLVEQRGGKVLVECQKHLLSLLAQCRGIDRLVPQGESLPAFDTHAALLSVPGILGTDLQSVPANIPYLSADAERIRKWGEELKGLTGFKIGIAWQGSKGFKDDSFRSIRLTQFEPLARIGGVRLISLQKGYGAEQVRQVPGWKVMDLGNRLDDFLDTAAVMKHLDLVICVDTAVGHLAGALGIPVWIAISTASDWRWLQQRDDSPWYPTLKLFRQKKRGDWTEVFERMARELETRPPLESAERYAQRGLAHLNQGQSADAVLALRRAIELDPKNAILHNNLGAALDKEGKKDEALASFQAAVRLKPDYADALHNLGNHLRRMGRLPEAEEEYRKALKLTPDSADLCNHLGIALLGQAKHGEAEASFRRSLRLKPDHAEAHNNLGVLFEQLGKVEESIASYQESLRLKPDSFDTHRNLALGYLMRGDYARGFEEYEWRWKAPTNLPRPFTQPRWDGRHLHGQAILLYSEQGLGDTIQFVRYARLVQERGGFVLLECPSVLERLFQRCPGIDYIIPQGASLPDFAFHIPLMSLPGVFRTTMQSIPAGIPYLSADPSDTDRWTSELASIQKVRIGIAWQGSQKYGGDSHRSIPLAAFEPLARLPDVQLFSLQKGYGSEQLQKVADWKVIDLGSRVNDFADTAAVMQHLDLVVCVDTAVAHLAGSLGVPVWLAVSMAADWRWLRHPETTPWYPTLRLFRQTRWGHWKDVFERIASNVDNSSFLLRTPLPAEMSVGELVDKIATLEIRRSRAQDEKELQTVQIELGGLIAMHARCVKPSEDLDRLKGRLKEATLALWAVEDGIRTHEQQKDFGDRFVELARSAYQRKDERTMFKEQINLLVGSGR
jgi:Flp pilus assembly protein TadD